MARIIVIGGGIAGLSAAYHLGLSGLHRVTVLELSNRLGGKIVTHYHDGLLVEGGPDSVFTNKPAAVELMEELGLESEFVEPLGGGFSVLVGGKLHAIPRALASLIPSANSALESIGFLGAAARRRIRSESDIPKGSGGDESIASFFRRRFGSHFSKTIAEPLLAGIHAGDAEKLSMKALYPTYIGLEQKNGKLTMEPNPTGHSGRRAGFLTLRSGLQRFVDTLIEKTQNTDFRLSFRIDSIERSSNGTWLVHGPELLEADALILAIPAYASAALLSELSPEASSMLSSIRHASTAVVTLAYSPDSFPKGLSGNGFLVPAGESCDITGCTYSSLKWPERASDGRILVRAFMGQDGGMNVDSFTDEELKDKAVHTIQSHIHAIRQPIFHSVDRWTKAMPQYDLGHAERMDQIEQALSNFPILLAGTSYRGTGIPDCIKQGRHSAQNLIDRFVQT